MRVSAAGVLGLDVSLLQSGMGGVAGSELACAVSEAGAAGCVGGYKLTDFQVTGDRNGDKAEVSLSLKSHGMIAPWNPQ